MASKVSHKSLPQLADLNKTIANVPVKYREHVTNMATKMTKHPCYGNQQ